jgi:hypothetical protein
MAAHRREMRLMTGVIERADMEGEFMELVIQETGNTPFWLGDDDNGDYLLDTVAEDTEKIELQNRVALLEQRLAEPVSHLLHPGRRGCVHPPINDAGNG